MFFTIKPFDLKRNSKRSGVSFRLYLFYLMGMHVLSTDMLVENLKEESLIAQRRVYDSIVASGGVLNVNITSGMLTFARQSHSSYQECLTQKQEKATNEEKKAKERKMAAEQIKVWEEKISKIKETAQQELRDIGRVISELEVS